MTIQIRHDMQTKRHATVWWQVKVMCGVLLIANFIVGRLFVPDQTLLALADIFPQTLVIAGGAIFIWHFVLVRKQNPSIDQPSILICRDGLFRFIRHPMYFSDVVIYAGFALLHCNLPALGGFVLAVVALVRQARVEDRYMAGIFPKAHARWQSRSSLLFPGIL